MTDETVDQPMFQEDRDTLTRVIPLLQDLRVTDRYVELSLPEDDPFFPGERATIFNDDSGTSELTVGDKIKAQISTDYEDVNRTVYVKEENGKRLANPGETHQVAHVLGVVQGQWGKGNL